MLDREDAQAFEEARPNLLGLAYRILGSMSDAEDAVQDTFLKWAKADRSQIQRSAAWLTTTCTRRCLDLLRSAQRSRVDYVGSWLPEPVHTPISGDAEDKLALARSLTTAFLLLLERLTPKERAAYLLREIFELPYAEIAEALDMTEMACRKLVSRAKANIGQGTIRQTVPLETQDRLLEAFQEAVKEGSTAGLAALLSDDIKLSADGGGKVPTLSNVLHGKDRVVRYIGKGLKKYWAGQALEVVDINGLRGLVLKNDGMTLGSVSFAYDDSGKVAEVFIMRNPEKLIHLAKASIH